MVRRRHAPSRRLKRAEAEDPYLARRREQVGYALRADFLDHLTRHAGQDPKLRQEMDELRASHQDILGRSLGWGDLCMAVQFGSGEEQPVPRSGVDIMWGQFASAQLLADRFEGLSPDDVHRFRSQPNPWEGLAYKEVAACVRDVKATAPTFGLRAAWGPGTLYHAMRTGRFRALQGWRKEDFSEGRGRRAMHFREHAYWLYLRAVCDLTYDKIAGCPLGTPDSPDGGYSPTYIGQAVQHAAQSIGLTLPP